MRLFGPSTNGSFMKLGKTTRFRFLAAKTLVISSLFAACGGGDDDPTVTCEDDCIAIGATPTCDGNTLIRPPSFGECVDGECVFTPTTTDCAANNQICQNGACVAETTLCDGVECAAAPAPACEGTVIVSTTLTGCDEASGECGYDVSRVDCAATSQLCQGGVCVNPPDPCANVDCSQPPEDTCDGTNVVTYEAGTCQDGTCTYPSTNTDCAEQGQFCAAGACQETDPCEDVVCEPLTDFCDGDTLVEYGRNRCVAGECEATEDRTNCLDDDLICENAECIVPGPCDRVTCDAAPGSFCDGSVAHSFAAAGTCTDGICFYDEDIENCPDTGKFCSDGVCVTPDACTGVVCNTPPNRACRADVVVAYEPTGTCVLPDGTCQYTELPIDCAESGSYCDAGTCIDLCDDINCAVETRDPECQGNIAVSFVLTGECTAGVCDAIEEFDNCTARDEVCVDGACLIPDLCAGITCDAAPTCEANVAVTYAGPGTCVRGVCDYSEVETRDDCSVDSLVCDSGFCREGAAILQPGDLLISELFRQPTSTRDQVWFEIQETQGLTRDLTGLVVSNGSGQSFTVGTGVSISPYGFVVFAASESAMSDVATVAWEGGSAAFDLAGTNGSLVLTGSVEIARVDYNSETWPSGDTFSISFDPMAIDFDRNDPVNWCANSVLYYNVQDKVTYYGTPGTMNVGCNPRFDSLIISEVMFNGTPRPGGTAENWIELYNPGAELDLGGLVVANSVASFIVPPGLVIGEGQYFVLGRSSGVAGGAVDFEYEGFDFNPTEDAVGIYDNAGELSVAVWGPASLMPVGTSAASARTAAGMLSDGSAAGDWCVSTTQYPSFAVNYGTPGEPNDCASEI
jgi:hypothetical protein